MKKTFYVISMLCIIFMLATGCGNSKTTIDDREYEPIRPHIVETDEKFEYYNELSDFQKELYNNLSECLKDPKDKMLLYSYSGKYQADYLEDAQIVNMKYMMDHPESNQILQGYIINSFQESKSNCEIWLIRKEVYNGQESTLNDDIERLKRVEKECKKFIDSIETTIPEEQYRLIHDWLAASDYDYNMEDQSHTLYGTIVERYAVCDGFAYSFKYLCDMLDIPSYVVIGSTAGESGDIGHAWNVVPIEGKWMLIDVTYDLYLSEYSNQISDKYFLKSELYSDSRRPYKEYRAPGYLF